MEDSVPPGDLQQRYRMLFELSPRVVYITTRDGRVIDANPAFFQMFGITREHLPNWNVVECYANPADRLRLLQDVDLHGQVDGFIVNLRNGDGQIRECEITTTLWRADNGDVLGYQGIIRDVTQEHELERALRDSLERYRLLSRATNDVVYDWNIETGEIQWNDALCNVFRYAPDEAEWTLQWWAAQIHPADSEAVDHSMTAALASDRDVWSAEYRFRCGDNKYATVFDRGYIVRDENGTAVRMIGSMVDLTQQKAAEVERQALEEQLRQAQKMEAIGKLAGGIAHDFNNLLTAVRGHAELLLEGHDARGEIRDGLQEIARAADRAAALTRQLLAFSRRQVLQLRVVDVNRVVQDMEKMLARLIGEHITLITSLDPRISKIKADPTQIEQVILNLAVNARDAMPDGGVLTIETAETELTDGDHVNYSYVVTGNYVLLRVRDNGIGMSKDTLERIFEPFFTTKAPGKGTGLGLSTVYGIVKQSDGYVWADSAPHCGTEFRIFLPAVRDTVETPEVRSVARTVERGSETILVVEDESAVRSLVRRILEKRGYHVLTAHDGIEALAVVAEHEGNIDLVVTDVVMPGMSGRELAQQLLKLRPNVRVLYMSGYTEDEVVRHGVLDRMVSFLPKPFSSDALADKVREILDEPVIA